MDQHRIIAGFSDLKLEFIGRCGITKDPQKLKLWFSYQNEVFWVHDYHNHKVKMVVAVKNSHSHSWHIYLREGRYAEQLMRYIIATATPDPINERARNLYESTGYFPYR